MRYEISERIAEDLFLAHDSSLDRRVVLRFLPENLQNEAKSAAALDHPYICKIYEIGEDNGKPFIAMEYVRGETLQHRLARGALPLAEVVRIASEIAEALETAHVQGIVHRDLKASNIMLTEGDHVKVMDFGLTKTQDNDPRSDILALGILLREMVASNAPEPLERVVAKMLEKNPDVRYQRVHDVRADLQKVQARPRSSRTKMPVATAALALLVVAGWFLFDALGPREPPSLAVLPLSNVSHDAETDYLADGMTRAVITRLTQAGLRVTPWETAQRYRDTGASTSAIAAELNVNNVLVGTFQLVEDRILTTLSLVEADGLQSWAADFDEPYEDIFRTQREIALGAASSLKQRLTGEEEEALARPESRSVDAYDFYLQGAHIIQDGTEEASNVALEYFARAIELDPGLAEAHVALGAVYADRYYYGWGGLGGLDQAEASYERALQLRPDSMTARRGLVLVSYMRGRSEDGLIQWREGARYARRDDVDTLLTRAVAYLFGPLADRAAPLFRRVLELDPQNEEALFRLFYATFSLDPEQAVEIGESFLTRFGDFYGMSGGVAMSYQVVGDYERAREYYERAMTEANLEAMVLGGMLLDELGERKEAEAAWRRGIELVEPTLEAYPDNVHMRLFLACFYGLLGDRASFLAEEGRALAVNVNDWAILHLAAVHARLGETERALELLHRAVRDGRIQSAWRGSLPLTFVSRNTPGFEEILEAYDAEAERLREIY